MRSVEKCFSISAYIKFCCKIIGSVIAGGNIKSIGAAGFRGGINVFSGWRRGVAFSENGIFMLFDGGLPRVLVPAVLNFLQMKGR